MNHLHRLQSRTLQRQRAKAVHNYSQLKPLEVLADSTPHIPEKMAVDHIKARAQFERLCNGQADTDDFDELAMVINICKVRAMAIDETLADMIERAQDAMCRCKERYLKLGRFGFDGPGIQQTMEAIEACEEIINNSSPMQMKTAMDIAVDSMYGKGTAKRMRAQAERSRMGGAKA